ncbi:MAG: CusA/CzcA family heavy metal efflux RND transporter [Longimicrobiales bacterium]
MIERLIGWAVRNRTMVLLGVAALIGGGVWALRTLRVDAFPDLTNVQVQVLAEAPGLSPMEVERLVTFPLEVSLNGLPRVTEIRSTSKYAFGTITVVFEEGTDIYFARTLVAERLQGVREELPAGAEVEMGPLAGAASEIYLYTLEGGGLDLMALRTLHDRVVKPQLRTVPGVTEINAFGGFVRQMQVTVDPERLIRYGVTLHDVIEAVKANSRTPAGAFLESGDEQFILRGMGQATEPEDLEQTVVRASEAGVPVLLGDLAEVDYGPDIRQGAVTRDGRGEVMSGIVMMLRDENSRQVVRRVRERVEEINRSLPEGVVLAAYYDQTDLVEGTIHTVEENLLLGGFLVIAVLLLFLGNVRAALVVAATIPLSLLFAAIGMRWLGLSANLMSLGAIDFGMIVDGSVVMAENFVKRLHDDEEQGRLPKDRGALLARVAEMAREVGRPVAFGVLIIMLVYVPILTLQGLEGRMFRPMALTVGMALFGSLLLALFFIPAAATFLFRRGAREARYAVRLSQWLDRRYVPVLRRTMAHPKATVAAAVAIFAATMVLVPRLGTEFLPELDEGSILVQPTRDPSISLTHSLQVADRVEEVVRQVPEVATVVSRVGRPDIGSDPMGLNQSDVFVMLRPRDEWRAGVTKEDLEEELEELLEDQVAGVAVGLTQPMKMRLDELISGVRSDLAVKVFGDDPDRNRQVAEAVAAAIRDVPGTSEVQVEQTQGQGYLAVAMDRAALARHGIPIQEVQEILEVAIGRQPVAEAVDGAYNIPITVQFPDAVLSSPEAIRSLTVPTGSGALIPLSALADIRMESGPVQVSRQQAQRLVIVQANVRGRDLGSYVADVQGAITERVDLPAGVFLTYGGQFENQERAMRRLQFVVPISMALIGLLLYASLQSWKLAGLVFLNLPFAAVGGVLALWLRGLNLSVSASIGFIALFGVAVLNGLVLLTTVQRARQAGSSPADAAEEGARDRLRPVLMTALVASIGFIPVAVSTGTGAEVQRPLATVVIGGLVTSTLLTLLVLPTLYAWIERRGSRPSPPDQAAVDAEPPVLQGV